MRKVLIFMSVLLLVMDCKVAQSDVKEAGKISQGKVKEWTHSGVRLTKSNSWMRDIPTF